MNGNATWRRFKTVHCDENRHIAHILRRHLRKHLLAPILDVGAGIGDIAARAFPDEPAILLDREPFTSTSGAGRHRRMRGDFLSLNPKRLNHVRTILFSHVLQYLDDDVAELQRQIDRIAPSRVIEVRNLNTGTFGNLIDVLQEALAGANPEVEQTYLGTRYKKITEVRFTATMSYPNFDMMAVDFCDLIMDAIPSRQNHVTTHNHLVSRLRSPRLSIQQGVRVFSAT